ncbi:hypothetical protein HPB51_024860 [Rhipicephalus microplus]|uniref:Uncharacterized protein n=1 Tax=Rhipicephalus microplus TaxID=6941 RepID=A0A9J6F9H4_RHIMP|nr:hypothetical protein HPB51_024860 [Rhipicephalus microplus]
MRRKRRDGAVGGGRATSHPGVSRSRALHRRNPRMCARVLRRAGFFAPLLNTHTVRGPLASPESLAAVEAAVPSSAAVARKKNNRAAAALEDYVVGGVAAHRLRRRGAPRCGRSDDVRAPPASIGGGPTSSALPFGLRRGVAVVSACGVLLVVVRRVWPYVPFVGAGERWIFVVRSVDRAAGPKRRRKAHDRSPVPARDRLPRCPAAARHVSTPTLLPLLMSAGERGWKGKPAEQTPVTSRHGWWP